MTLENTSLGIITARLPIFFYELTETPKEIHSCFINQQQYHTWNVVTEANSD
jgi:hypothetical protein